MANIITGMSKYEPLWNWIKENSTDSFKLTFDEMEKIAGLPIDHSFLNYKMELLNYGHINIKIFHRIIVPHV